MGNSQQISSVVTVMNMTKCLRYYCILEQEVYSCFGITRRFVFVWWEFILVLIDVTGWCTCLQNTRMHRYACVYNKKSKFFYSAVSNPQDRSKYFTLYTCTSLADLFTQTLSRLLWGASSHMLQLMHEGCSYTYPPLSIVRYSFIQLSELEQCRTNLLEVLAA